MQEHGRAKVVGNPSTARGGRVPKAEVEGTGIASAWEGMDLAPRSVGISGRSNRNNTGSVIDTMVSPHESVQELSCREFRPCAVNGPLWRGSE